MIYCGHLQLLGDFLVWLLNLFLFYLMKRLNLFQFFKIILSSVLLFPLKRFGHLLVQIKIFYAFFFQLRFELLKFLLLLVWFFLVRCLSVYCSLLMIGYEHLHALANSFNEPWYKRFFSIYLLRACNRFLVRTVFFLHVIRRFVHRLNNFGPA